MEKFLVQDFLQICEELGISGGSSKTRKTILAVMLAEHVMAEEGDEAWEIIVERKLQAEKRGRRELEAQRREPKAKEHGIREQESVRHHALRMKELDRKIQALRRQRARGYLYTFTNGEYIVIFLSDFERACEEVRVSRDLWSKKLVTLPPSKSASVLERLSSQEARDYGGTRRASLRHIDALSQADCEGQDDGYNVEPVGDRPVIEKDTTSVRDGNALVTLVHMLSDEREHIVVSPSREAALEIVAIYEGRREIPRLLMAAIKSG